jgi:D-tyrosyl-tRNA(Tyr) deacylase
MKALVQRVSRGCVSVGGEAIGAVGRGYVVLVGVRPEDTEEDARYLAARTLSLRVFADGEDRMNLSVHDVEGQILVVSQFTLYADTRKGNRPSFIGAAPAEQARALYECYVEALRRGIGPSRVATGRFGARMTVEIVNDGPVTIELCSDHR